jgi:3-phenylpropionate/trans-cinnamate dioxygenase ferredoxin reductase subunit
LHRGRDRIVVVGASVAGLAACEALREHGWDGEIVLVGEEPHPPYDRPPLSKQLLLGDMLPEDLVIRDESELASLDLDVYLGCRAVGLDVPRRSVQLDHGGEVVSDAVIVATGSKPVRMPGQPVEPPFFELRTLSDGKRLRPALEGAERVVVAGAGFIGLEVAAAARTLGCEVAVVEAAPYPLGRVCGATVGEALVELHSRHGVAVRCGRAVSAMFSTPSGTACVRLSDDRTTLEADVVVVGIGAKPAVDWLAGSGLELRNGVCCNGQLEAATGIWAAGDVARWAHPLFGPIRVEHWTTARDHARTVARNVISSISGGGEPTTASAVPYFWSDQHGVKIQMAGWTAGADEIEEVSEGRRRLFRFGHRGRLVAALTWDWPRRLAEERRQIATGVAFGGVGSMR